jgi:hypothetical protein
VKRQITAPSHDYQRLASVRQTVNEMHASADSAQHQLEELEAEYLRLYGTWWQRRKENLAIVATIAILVAWIVLGFIGFFCLLARMDG